jgi:hypothetical protein
VDRSSNAATEKRFTYRPAKVGLTAVGGLFIVASIGALTAGNPRWFALVILAIAISFTYIVSTAQP